METLTPEVLIGVLRERYELRLESAKRELATVMKRKGEEIDLISPELKVKSKKTGLRYTVDSVGTNSIVLKTPEGRKLVVSKDSLEKEYELP